ncbi:peptide ABC transporter permease [Deinococcus radiopugnans]|uniref:Peptide ABC transporter permease n=2 Tax=Deinococcus radiopugnans TaxID=57497 RepID=A0A0A7KD66_9DEIO|nr:ABC transporter permease [Deinococcus radiopugnans]AIZ44117.1 peptide ABC transporter permease [Deinococcus radiopugnans]MBB6017398.1 peptide/nickel transport system permease protein [Deinococcus radiopugnans ATCC 19172]QLG09642.1 ABC transporter permease [Deinococcus sp. D7000]TNM70140.1 ABC transporter permease [Deinococcus radiopugnans ATCC 19172]
MTITAPAPPAEKSYSALQMSMRRLLRHKAAMISLAFIIFVVLAALLAPLIAPHDPNAQDLSGFFAPPSASYPLGQDELGRDVLSRVIYGSRISLVVGFSVAIISVLLGTLAGLVAGFFGGLTDSAISRFIEFMLSLPTLPLQLVISGLFASSDAPFITNLRENLGPSASVVIIISIFAIFGWMGTARLVRGEVLRLKNLEYVDAARALGANNNRVMWRHLAPNMLGIIVVSATIDVAGAILGEAALSFLGFGIQPPVSTWGNMLSNAQEVVLSYPWLPFYPGLAILFTVLAFNFLGDGLRDAFDPKSRR